jgi:hypothetical protein
VARLYGNVPVLDAGARGSTITFAQRNQGDVLIAWENEAFLLEKEFGAKFDVVVPSLSILAEPAVAVVDRNVDRKRTRTVAEEYLKYPVLGRGPGHRRQELLPPRRLAEGPGQVRPAVPEDPPVHDRAGLRRLGQGGQGALCRRRQLRPDLYPEVMPTSMLPVQTRRASP